MNHVHSVVWNASIGAWIVASELARSRKKVACRRMGVLATLSSLSMIPSLAFAQACGTSPVGTYTSTIICQTTNTPAQVTTQTGTSIMLDAGANDGVIVQSDASDSTANIDGTTVDNTLGGGNGITVSQPAGSGVGNISVNFSGNNTILLGTGADTAVLVQGGSIGAINVTGTLDIANNANFSSARGGLEVSALGDLASLDHQGTGTISVWGGNAVLIGGNGTNTSASTTIGNGVTLLLNNTNSGNYGYSNAGLRSYTQDGALNIITAASIQTTGNFARGIFANTSNGAITIDNRGAISTRGNNSEALYASSSDGAITLANSGDLHTLGVESTAILASLTDGAGSANIAIHNTGTIVTNGRSLFSGFPGPMGIHGGTFGSGDVTITGSGDITTSNPAAFFAYAVNADTASGTASVEYSGTLTTHGNYSAGIYAQTSGGGDIDINYTGNLIEVFGSNTEAIGGRSYSGGAVRIRAQGELIGHALEGSGILVSGIVASSSGGAIDVAFTGTRIDIAGTNAAGISVNNLFSGGTGDSTISVLNEGSILMHGQESIGITTLSSTGSTHVFNTGPITTLGDFGHGIYTVSTDGAVDIRNEGVIGTQGLQATGISALVNNPFDAIGTLGATVANTALIDIGGTGASAIAISVAGSGEARLEQSGDLTINPADSDSAVIFVASQSGDATVNMSGGSVTNRGSGVGIEARAGTDGNATINLLGGSVSTEPGAAIVAWGMPSDPLATDMTGVGNMIVTTGAGTTISSATDRGIVATSLASLEDGTSITVDSQSIISAGTNGIEATAINGAPITVTQTGGSISAGQAGIVATGGDGTVTVENSGTIDTSGSSDSHGIDAASQAGALLLINSGAITTQGTASSGMRAIANTGAIDIVNSGYITLAGDTSMGIFASVFDALSAANITIANQGAITVNGDSAQGVFALNSGTGNVLLTNAGDIQTEGEFGIGMQASALLGSVDITNSAGITTTGSESDGVLGFAEGDLHIANSGDISTMGADSRGILAQGAGSVEVENAAGGTIESAADGIFANNIATGTVSVDNAGEITTAGADAAGVRALGSDAVSVSNAANGRIQGGSVTGAGVAIGGATQTLTNAGSIEALSDRAIVGDSNGAGSVTIGNSGTLLGTITAVTSTVAMDNSGNWSLRNFADTDGDGVRETLAVAISNFGSSGTNTINNSGTIALLTHDGSGTALDTTGMYLPFGNANHTIALASPAQGQLLGVQTFQHSGVIDMQANPSVGDVFIITGGQTAGVDGGGVFVSDGGSLLLDTVLDDGGADYLSDVLVVDSTRTGLGPTGLVINNVGGSGAQTVGDGIAVVEVLNSSASAADAFNLASRAFAGAYEYLLFRGGSAANGGDPDDGNWYLRSEAPPPPPCEETGDCPPPPPCEQTNTCPPPPPPPCEETGDCPLPPPPVALIRPEVGAYLGNQLAAANQFVHTLHDRLGEVDYSERQRDGSNDRHAAAWTRVERRQFDARAGFDQLDVGTDTSLWQSGAEFGRWTDGDARWHAGAMGTITQSTTHSHSEVTGYGAKGSVKGYALGVYGTWYQSAAEPTGLYLDAWLQYGWFRNKVMGHTLAQERYDSNAWAISLEAGYAIAFAQNDARAWYVEPQAQIIHTDFSADHHVEFNGTRVDTPDVGSLITRLGARLYTRPQGQPRNRVQPFLALNWWHYDRDGITLHFNDKVQPLDHAADIYELKLGAQLELSDHWTGWGHIALREADGDTRDVSGLIGVKYGW